ncbi:unnamed protein product [Aphis gossypii]|uniref:Uncharacterized protein n=1 Tax=Aphis gossypii TaxID=80765 RepID=A0A9P0J7M0_APHGO|nr:unnamed protein product [Aphis gossypii]
MTLSNTSIGAVLSGVAGLCFLSYYILFGFNSIRNWEDKSTNNKKLVRREIDMIFTREVNMGEDYLSRGDIARSVKHLAKAMVLCREPFLLYQVLQNRLPKKVFNMLNQKLEQQLKSSDSRKNRTIRNLGL